jgi:hypothetical protein
MLTWQHDSLKVPAIYQTHVSLHSHGSSSNSSSIGRKVVGSVAGVLMSAWACSKGAVCIAKKGLHIEPNAAAQ